MIGSEEKRAKAFFSEKKKEALEEIQDYSEKHLVDEEFNWHLIDGQLPQFDVVFTTVTGAHRWNSHQRITRRFLKGKYYGVTRLKGQWLFARSNNHGFRSHLVNERLSDICQVTVSEEGFVDCIPVIYGIPGEIHQIDHHGGKLILPHTDFAQVLMFDVDQLTNQAVPLSIEDATFIPINANPAAHLNSIYVESPICYLVAHNYTWKTGNKSELIRWNMEKLCETRTQIDGHSAHNCIPWKGDLLFCDSERGTLRWGSRELFQTNTFLRGLSISPDFIFVGGSDVQFGKNFKKCQNSYIYILNHSGKHLATAMLPQMGDIYEIRQFSGPDYAMSERKQKVIL